MDWFPYINLEFNFSCSQRVIHKSVCMFVAFGCNKNIISMQAGGAEEKQKLMASNAKAVRAVPQHLSVW
jgi:hypothetical protein